MSVALRTAATFAVVAGLAGASCLVLLCGISEFLGALGAPRWTADLLPGAVGLVAASLIRSRAARRFPAGGLSPSQALSQLRDDIALASTASAQRRPGDDDVARDAQASR